MNISPIGNNYQAFRGSVIVNNLKANKVEKFITDKSADKHLKESFDSIIGNRMFVMKSQSECLKNLKTCVNNFAEIIGNGFGKDLKYPAAKDISVMYSSGKDISNLNVTGYFSIIHSVK